MMLAQLFSERTVLIVITLVGMAICTAGVGPVAAKGEWLHPLSIVGIILGIVILGLAGAVIFGVRLPGIESPWVATILVLVFVAVKIGLTQIHRALI